MGVANSEGVMTLGQVSEIFFLLLVPFFFRKLGVKKMLMVGMFFWVARYVLFAEADAQTHALLFLGVLFHGICYDFFFVTGQLYVDKAAPDDVRSGAQGFIAFVTLGAGMFVGGLLSWWYPSNDRRRLTGRRSGTSGHYGRRRTGRLCPRFQGTLQPRPRLSSRNFAQPTSRAAAEILHQPIPSPVGEPPTDHSSRGPWAWNGSRNC